MKKNKLITAIFFFAVIALFCIGCAGGARSIADAYLDNAGVPLGKPFKDSGADGTRYVWIAEGIDHGIEGVSFRDFTEAKYLVVRLHEQPTATITISWSGQVDGEDLWWNPSAFSLGSPGVEWKSESKQLWIELSKVLADYDKYAASNFHARLFFPNYGTGDGGVYGDDYIIAGWLMMD